MTDLYLEPWLTTTIVSILLPEVSISEILRSILHTHMHTTRPSEVLMYLCSTKVLRASTGKSTWGELVWGCICPRVTVLAPKVPPGPHSLARHGQQFDFPSYYQVLTDVTAGWAASLVNIRSPFIQLGRLEQCE